MRLMFVIIALVVLLPIAAAQQSDSVKRTPSERTQKFFDSLKTKSQRVKILKLLVNNVLRGDTAAGQVVDQAHIYSRFEGMTIDQIIIDNRNIYSHPKNWLERTANNLHAVTRAKKIRYDLLFRPGEPLDPELIVRTQQLLRSRSYIYDALILVRKGQLPGTVDIEVLTRDSWTISGDLRLSGSKTYIGLYDANIFGSGNKLRVNTNLHTSFKHWGYGGNIVEFDMTNIMGSFISLETRIGKEFEYSDVMLKLEHEFIKPNDYMAGVMYNRPSRPTFIADTDTLLHTNTITMDGWAGLSRQLKGRQSSLFATGRFTRSVHRNRPEVSPTYNPSFHNNNLSLLSLGLYRERFLTTSLIFGYGNREYIPTGYKAEILGGYYDGEFNNSWYIGGNYSLGGLFSGGNYMAGRADFGTYITEHGQMERTAMRIRFEYYSRLLESRSIKVRQMVGFDYTQGWNRLSGNYEILTFFNGGAMPRSFRKYVTGTNRAVVKTETILFTPLQPLGFRMAFFAFADVGLIGYDPNILRNDLFTTLGLGVRIKNERLIFSAIQITLGICIGKGGLIGNQLFRSSNQQKLSEIRFKPFEPETIYYR